MLIARYYKRFPWPSTCHHIRAAQEHEVLEWNHEHIRYGRHRDGVSSNSRYDGGRSRISHSQCSREHWRWRTGPAVSIFKVQRQEGRHVRDRSS